MVFLRCRDWIRQSLFFLLAIFFLHFQYVNAATPVTLEKETCLQKCFTSTCPDFDTGCVCNSLLEEESVTQAGLCAKDSCTEPQQKNAFANLAQECSVLLTSSGTPKESSGVAMAGSSKVTSTGLSDFVSLTETPTATPKPTTPSQTTAPTTTPAYPTDLGLLPTASSPSNTTAGSSTGGQNSQSGQLTDPETEDEPVSDRGSPLLAVYIIAPISIISATAALYFVLRRRRNARRSIISFAGVKGWNLSQMTIVRRDDEEQANNRPPPVPRIMSQITPLQPFPPPPPPPPQQPPPLAQGPPVVNRSSIEKALPQPPPLVYRPITTISEVSEPSPLETGTVRTMDSELQQAFLDVRRGFQPSLALSSAPSSARTSMEWSMMSQSPSDTRRDSEMSK